MSARQTILIATGADRPGVLDDVSMYLHEQNADILESRVSLLRGQFALLLLIRAEDAAMTQIADGLGKLAESAKIHIELRPADEAPSRDDTPLRLKAAGHDPANSVQRISHLMRVLNVNIENIETAATLAGADGKNDFRLEMDLCVPRATPVLMLKQYVQSLAEEIGIQCEVNTL